MLIGIEDIIGNALIETKEKLNVNYITMTQAKNYASEVIKNLRMQGINARFYTDRYKFEEFKNSYAQYFSLIQTDTDVICYINPNITVEDLEQKFRGYLSVTALLAFIDNDVFSNSLITPCIIESRIINNPQLKKEK